MTMEILTSLFSLRCFKICMMGQIEIGKEGQWGQTRRVPPELVLSIIILNDEFRRR